MVDDRRKACKWPAMEEIAVLCRRGAWRTPGVMMMWVLSGLEKRGGSGCGSHGGSPAEHGGKEVDHDLPKWVKYLNGSGRGGCCRVRARKGRAWRRDLDAAGGWWSRSPARKHRPRRTCLRLGDGKKGQHRARRCWRK